MGIAARLGDRFGVARIARGDSAIQFCVIYAATGVAIEGLPDRVVGMPHSSLAIANEFLARAFEGNRSLTHMQSQKLTYLAHGWSLGSGHGPLIEEMFEAWAFGPVIRKLYDALKKYGSGNITQFIQWGEDTPLNGDMQSTDAFVQYNAFERDLLDYVSTSYGQFTAYQLSSLTHLDGTPWQKTYVAGQNRVISNELIEEYFVRLAQQD
jgi:uncharacterized phage-associated protein